MKEQIRTWKHRPYCDVLNGEILLVGTRSDEYEVMVRGCGARDEGLKYLDSYLLTECRCDSANRVNNCPLHSAELQTTMREQDRWFQL